MSDENQRLEDSPEFLGLTDEQKAFNEEIAKNFPERSDEEAAAGDGPAIRREDLEARAEEEAVEDSQDDEQVTFDV
jgi:hypothetical protein